MATWYPFTIWPLEILGNKWPVTKQRFTALCVIEVVQSTKLSMLIHGKLSALPSIHQQYDSQSRTIPVILQNISTINKSATLHGILAHFYCHSDTATSPQ